MNINLYFSNMRLMNISLHNKTSSRYIYSHLIYPIIPLRSIMGFPVVQLLRSCIFGHNYPFENNRRSNLGFPVVQLLCSCIFGHNYPFASYLFHYSGFLLNNDSAVPFLLTPSPINFANKFSTQNERFNYCYW